MFVMMYDPLLCVPEKTVWDLYSCIHLSSASKSQNALIHSLTHFLTCLLWYLLYTQEHFHLQNQQPSVSGSPSVPDMTPVNHINKTIDRKSFNSDNSKTKIIYYFFLHPNCSVITNANSRELYKIWSLLNNVFFLSGIP